MPDLYVYVVTHATGFAPNPFHGFCTLACCKPIIRRVAKPGDYVAGLSRRAQGNKLLYAMQVERTLPFEKYWEEFEIKKADMQSDDPIRRLGDNIYKPEVNKETGLTEFTQQPSMHSNGLAENQANKAHDLSGKNVLIASEGAFVYPGPENPVPLKQDLYKAFTPLSRGHRSRFDRKVIDSFQTFFEGLLKTYRGNQFGLSTQVPKKCTTSCS
ncbi:MAG: hypothetical protein KQH53_00810 [Desulfarculaceae bacterium]|nr:hypothetical protein [Desulfarculaceae bacterium]